MILLPYYTIFLPLAFLCLCMHTRNCRQVQVDLVPVVVLQVCVTVCSRHHGNSNRIQFPGSQAICWSDCVSRSAASAVCGPGKCIFVFPAVRILVTVTHSWLRSHLYRSHTFTICSLLISMNIGIKPLYNTAF